MSRKSRRKAKGRRVRDGRDVEVVAALEPEVVGPDEVTEGDLPVRPDGGVCGTSDPEDLERWREFLLRRVVTGKLDPAAARAAAAILSTTPKPSPRIEGDTAEGVLLAIAKRNRARREREGLDARRGTG